MIRKPRRGLFITGTDTGIGKTYVTALIARQLITTGKRVGVYKPVATGCRREGRSIVSDDAQTLWEAAGRPLRRSDVCPQCFAAPLAPQRAAQAENREVDSALLREGIRVWTDCCDIVLVEGVGGLMSPLSEDEFVADLAYDFDYPLIVVAPNRLGVVNQTLLTLIGANTFREGLEVAGIVLNDLGPSNQQDASASWNVQDLRERAIPPILAHVEYQQNALNDDVDWFEIAKREKEFD
jgi:dethiobiotin synthetase